MAGRGLHHVTAITTNAARNFAFYTNVLGLRLEKRTVTHEDPGAYHLIYGRGDGAPAHLSFFSWPTAASTGTGLSDTEFVSLAVAPEAIVWWEQRFKQYGVPCRRTCTALGHAALMFEDPDHTPLALAASPHFGPLHLVANIPAEFAVGGLFSVSLSISAIELMSDILTNVLGFVAGRREGDWAEFLAHGEPGGAVYLHRRRERSRPRLGAGSLHHLAFRAKDEADQTVMAEILRDHFKIVPSPLKDRYYFRSIYFRGADGLLIEISTDGPGLLIDEPQEKLGTRLIFPPAVADREEELLRILPPLV